MRRGLSAAASAVVQEPPPGPSSRVRTHPALPRAWAARAAAGRAGPVPRPRLGLLLDRLDAPVIALAAPAGAGKTVLLSQWAAGDDRAVRWVSLAGADGAAAARRIVEALLRVAPFDRRLAADLAVPAGAPDRDAIGRIAGAVARAEPFLLLVDDTHDVRGADDLLAAVAAAVPAGSRVVLSGRRRPGARHAPLRCAGLLADVGADELAMTGAEIAATLESVGLRPDPSLVEGVGARTEGWALGVHALAVSLRRAERTGGTTGGLPAAIAEHLSAEVLGGLPPRARDLLMRTSVLERVSAPLAVFMTGDDRAGADLHALGDRGVPMTVADDAGDWLRANPLLREHLLGELRRRAPTVEPGLHLLASRWHAEHGMPDEAFAHALRAGDRAAAGRLFEAGLLRDESRGRHAELARRRAGLGTEDARDDAGLAIAMAWHDAAAGAGDAERLVAIAEAAGAEDGLMPLGFSSPVSALAAWRAMFGRRGADELRASARAVDAAEPESARMRGVASELLGASLLVDGRLGEAEAALRHALSLLPDDLAWHAELSRGLLAVGALLGGDTEGALAAAIRATEQATGRGLAEADATAPAVATLAAALALRGDAVAAEAQLARARRVLAAAERRPWLALLTTLVCASAARALGDAASAASLLARCERLAARWPAGAALSDRIAREREEPAALTEGAGVRRAAGCAPAELSDAELRVLRMLPAGGSLAEIARAAHLSRNTVKTHVAHIYRKLGVSSRREAVERALVLDLLGG